jgi:hypothetical protein
MELKQMKKLLGFILITFMCGANAQQNSIGPSIYTASEFQNAPATFKEGYVVGVVDGIMASPLLGNDYKRIEKLRSCVYLMDTKTLSSVVDAYIRVHSESQDAPINLVTFWAVRDACKSKGKERKGHYFKVKLWRVAYEKDFSHILLSHND